MKWIIWHVRAWRLNSCRLSSDSVFSPSLFSSDLRIDNYIPLFTPRLFHHDRFCPVELVGPVPSSDCDNDSGYHDPWERCSREYSRGVVSRCLLGWYHEKGDTDNTELMLSDHIPDINYFRELGFGICHANAAVKHKHINTTKWQKTVIDHHTNTWEMVIIVINTCLSVGLVWKQMTERDLRWFKGYNWSHRRGLRWNFWSTSRPVNHRRIQRTGTLWRPDDLTNKHS